MSDFSSGKNISVQFLLIGKGTFLLNRFNPYRPGMGNGLNFGFLIFEENFTRCGLVDARNDLDQC